MIICSIASVIYTVWYYKDSDSIPYLEINTASYADNSISYNLFARFGNWILMFGNFVPISLLVTLEMVKFT